MSLDYKVVQVASFFMTGYGYRRVMINGLLKTDEYFLYLKENPFYQLIRISSTPLEENEDDEKRIGTIKEVIKKQARLNILEYLDIRISNENPEGIQNLLCLEENHFAGEDIRLLYPGIDKVVHSVTNEEEEIKRLAKQIRLSFIRETKKKFLSFKKEYMVTYIFIGLCILNFIFQKTLVHEGYTEVSAEVFLGADYRTFTYGLHQYYRLFTYGLVHGSWTHLLCNMYSMFIIGRYIENRYGSFKYLCIIVFSTIAGGLVNGILSTNGVIVGISGALYALLAMFALEMVLERRYISRSIVYILFLNFMMNFLPGIGWEAHLGGFMFGIIAYFVLKDGKINRNYAICALVMMLVLGFKYGTNKEIKPFYNGTDYEICEMMEEYISEEAAEKCWNECLELYKRGQ